jgi:dedicator of cytokinesis protein 3
MLAKKQLAAEQTAPLLGGDFFHLFVELRAFVANPCSPGETCELYFALYSRAINQYISEEYLVIMNSSGSPATSKQSSADGTLNLSRVRTLFQDLGPQDVGEVLLVCRIVRCGAMKMSAVGSQASPGSSIRSLSTMNEAPSDTSSVVNGRSGQNYLQPPSSNSSQPRTKTSTAPFRRPFGCAVLDVSQFVKGAEDTVAKPREVTMQIFVPTDEGSFATLHEDIIHSRTSQFERSQRYVDAKILGP